MNMWDAASPFGQSLVIFLREGAEAVLIVAALWVVLRGMSAPRAAFRALLGGAGAAVVASVLAGAALFSLYGALNEEVAELVEGIAMLAAAVVLVFVSSWLLGQREARHWQDTLRQRARAAFTSGGLLALFAVGFLAVFREGVETVLFIAALVSAEGAQIGAITAGAMVVLLVLLVAFMLVRISGVRLPLRQFFTVTAWALLALAVIYAGKGVHELQEAHMVAETALSGWPKIKPLGIYPYVETLVAQVITLGVGLLLNTRVLRRAGDAQGAPAR